MSDLQLPGFERVEHIGSGGLGDVYVAHRASTGGPVAIKVLRHIGSVADVQRRVDREMAAMLRLKGHPAVIHIEEVVETPEGPALVMEYAAGGSLLDAIDRTKGLPFDEVARLGIEVGGLLADAHDAGIVHRDIKPHNVLLTVFGSYKVCDFGIAVLTRESGHAEQTSAVSYRYASPEELDDLPASGASDVFSLGVTMTQAITGTTAGVRSPHLVQFPGVDEREPELCALLERMVAADPARRPTAAEARGACNDLIRGRPAATRPPAPDTDDTTLRVPSQNASSAPPLPLPTTDDDWWTT